MIGMRRRKGFAKAGIVASLNGSRGLKESVSDGQMATIVEYSAEKPARNGYPKKIISPPLPSQCCLTHMKRIGEMQVEGNGHRFYYKRCTRCGFTVREFVFNIGLDRLRAPELAEWNRAASWIDLLRREAQADIAA